MRSLPAVLLLAFVSASAGAQEGKPCKIAFTGLANTSMNIVTTSTGAKQTFVSGGGEWRCEGQGNRLLADSAEHYEDRGELILIGRVRYSEPRVNMQSDRMIYYTVEDRLHATGNVRGRTNTGTRFNGPEMEYFRAKPGVRDAPHWRAPGRPTVRMAPNDTLPRRPPTPGQPAVNDSTDLTADVVISENDSLVWAVGKVEIDRRDLRATGDSATLDQGTGFARLMKTPRIVGRGDRPFTMTGTEIDMWSKEQKLERVRSSGTAQVVSDSLTLVGDTIDLRFRDQLMQRVFTWGGRAKADTPDQQMEADSLDILMPGQHLQELHAIGKAIAYTVVDSLKIQSKERDWISGDTIVALFDSAVAGDTSSRTRMKGVTATGKARAFYQLAPSSGEKGPPNLSYNTGRQIVVSFTEGEVEKVDVKDRATGLFLEPAKAETAKGDTTAAPGAKPPKRP